MVPILAMSMILACGQAPEAGPPVVHASLVSDAPRVDGVLEEPAWQSAHVVGGFRQREPNEGAPATEATEVRVVYTRDALFIGIMAFDRDPGRVLARVLRRDRLIKAGSDGAYEFAGDDTVAIVIDPFQDHRNAFLFATNANGAEFDALVTDESAVLNADWRGVWKVAARRTRDGWSAELAIPFRTLRYPQTSEPARWGFNVERVIRRKNEHTLWAGWQRAGGGLHRVSRAGLVDDLAGLPRSSLHAEVKPYGLVGGVRDTSSTVREWQHLWRVGGDLKWQPVPGLTLDATARPDFTQVESDQQVINLTRFELYFPEKREFFLENAGVFEFGTRGSYETPPFLLFFSRRIGAGPDGGEVPVLGGTRLTGRAGRQTIGVLAVVTEDAAGQPLTSFAVARIKRDVGRRGYVGAMAADRRTSAAASTDAGIDGSLWPTAHLNVQGFLARTKASSRPGLAGRVAAEYSGDPWYAYGEYLVVGWDAQTAMGFVTRTDMRRSSAKVQYTVRPHLAGVRQVSLYAGGKYLTRIDGKPQDGNWFPGVSVVLDSGDNASLTIVRGYSVLDAGFTLAGRLPVGAGRYDLRDVEVSVNSSTNRPVSFSGQVSRLGLFGGHLNTTTGTVQIRPGTHVAVGATYSNSRVTLPSGQFETHLPGVRVEWTHSTRLAAAAYLQYDTLNRRFLGNLRLHLIHRPGSDLILAWNEERGTPGAPWSVISRGGALKPSYLWQF